MEYVGIRRAIQYTDIQQITHEGRVGGGGGDTHTYTHANIKRSFSTISLCSRQMSKYQHQHTFQIVEKGPCTPLTIISKTSKMNANGRARERKRVTEEAWDACFLSKTFDTYILRFVSFHFFALNEITEWSVWQKKVNKEGNKRSGGDKEKHTSRT